VKQPADFKPINGIVKDETILQGAWLIICLLSYRLICPFSFSIGTAARCGLWPVEQYPSIFSYLSPTLSIIIISIQLVPLLDFRNNKFYCVGLLAPRQTPNLEDQGIPFCLGHHP
jgi:hypothetical protein